MCTAAKRPVYDAILRGRTGAPVASLQQLIPLEQLIAMNFLSTKVGEGYGKPNADFETPIDIKYSTLLDRLVRCCSNCG